MQGRLHKLSFCHERRAEAQTGNQCCKKLKAKCYNREACGCSVLESRTL